tara:strand:+ start:159 stop:413 length:255 start_codon:yes stop_codon:yes gene_type:complete
LDVSKELQECQDLWLLQIYMRFGLRFSIVITRPSQEECKELTLFQLLDGHLRRSDLERTFLKWHCYRKTQLVLRILLGLLSESN